MARKFKVPPVSYEIDYKYHDPTLSKFVNSLMSQGKKSTARKIAYGALAILKEKVEGEELETFHQALGKVKPELEVKSRRVGGATYQVPIEISSKRKQALAIRWLISGARKRSGKSMEEKLAAELMDAFHSTGAAFKKKEETHRTAESNKAFSHYRW